MVLLPGNFLLCNPLTATVVAAALGYAPTSTMIASGQPLWFEHAVCVCVCVCPVIVEASAVLVCLKVIEKTT